MTLITRPFTTLPQLLAELEGLALSNRQIVFRGHQYESWKIESTYLRYTTIPHQSWSTTIDDLLSHFLSNLVTLGEIPFSVKDRRARLEFGRHHGIPTPVVDFTYSPYVAMFFAFNNLRYDQNKPIENAAVYALDLSALAMGRAKHGLSVDMTAYNDFLYERPDYFLKGYPAHSLKWIPFSASWNKRMRNQLGAFLYDTVDYRMVGAGGCFEGYVEAIQEPPGPDSDDPSPTLIKFLIPHTEAGKVFARLEMMNITATKLLDHEGIASDVKNAYYYTPKSIDYAWDIGVPPPD